MKSLFHSLSTLIIILILAAVIILFLGWSRVPDMLANTLSKKMKVAVEIDDIDLSTNSIEIEKMEIGNPKNSMLPKAFSCEFINIFFPLMNYLDENIVIDMIKIDDIYLGLEFEAPGKTQGNWKTIMGNFKASESPSKSKKTVTIKKLILSNIRVDLAYKTGDRKIQKLPLLDHLEFDDVRGEEGVPLEQITAIIFKHLLKSVLEKDNLKNMREAPSPY